MLYRPMTICGKGYKKQVYFWKKRKRNAISALKG